MPLVDLPTETLWEIAGFLKYRTLLELRKTCRRLRNVVDSGDGVECCLQVNPLLTKTGIRMSLDLVTLKVLDDNLFDIPHSLLPNGLPFWLSRIREIEVLGEVTEHSDMRVYSNFVHKLLTFFESWESPPWKFRLVIEESLCMEYFPYFQHIIRRINRSSLEFSVDALIKGPQNLTRVPEITKLGKKFTNIRFLALGDYFIPSDWFEFSFDCELEMVRIAGYRNRSVWDLGAIPKLFTSCKSVKTVSFIFLNFKVDNNTDLNDWKLPNVQSLEFENCKIVTGFGNNGRTQKATPCEVGTVQIRVQDASEFLQLFEFPRLKKLEIYDGSYRRDRKPLMESSLFLTPVVGNLEEFGLLLNSWKEYDIMDTEPFANSKIKRLWISGYGFNKEKLSRIKLLENLEELVVFFDGPQPAIEEPQNVIEEKIAEFVKDITLNCEKLQYLEFLGHSRFYTKFERETQTVYTLLE